MIRNKGEDFMDIYLPLETKRNFLNLERDHSTDKNYNLLFNKYIKWSSNKIDRDRFKNLSCYNFKNLCDNISKIKSNLNIEGYKKNSFEMKCSGRIIIGLGGSHVAETSMTLHHIYGVPYIPGSALKGVTRHYFLIELFEKTQEDNNQILCFEKIIENIDKSKIEEELKDLDKFRERYKVNGVVPSEKIIDWFKNKDNKNKIENFQKIFGTQNNEGKVIFMDSYPKELELKIDIMNPHYSTYYDKAKTPPADYINPVPINFLVVENSIFTINLLSKDEELLKNAYEKLKEALTEYGIGAKTSLGYGIFDKPEDKKDNK